MSSASSPDGAPSARPALFRAIAAPPKRRRWPWVMTMAAVITFAVFATLYRKAGSTQVFTAKGVRTVQRGMTTREVNDLLGKPFDVRREADGSDCFKYGHPTMERPSFVVYRVCYEEGRLREVTTHEYTASVIAPGGEEDGPPAPGSPAVPPGEGG